MEGYWNYNHIALQVEDVFDILSIKFPGYYFCFLLDQSSGHGRQREGSLNANLMNQTFGGKQVKLRDSTKIKDLGPYHHILQLGDTQSMIFTEVDADPFYMHEAHTKKYDQISEKCKTSKKTKKQLIRELKGKGVNLIKHYSRDQLHQLALENEIVLTFTEPVVIPGWLGKPKGLLQVLWERGWINEVEIGIYSVDGEDEHRDENNQVKDEFQRYVLRTLMRNCADFREEKSAMETLLIQFSQKSDNTSVELLTSPKYHCELAGEGVEYLWGMSKRHYRSIPLSERNTKEKFEKSARKSLCYVSRKNICLFAARCRRYMMAYNAHHDSNCELIFELIEKFIKKTKTHRNIGDQEKGFVEQVWRESAVLQVWFVDNDIKWLK